MKVLLIQPAKAPLTIGGEDFHIYEPLALEYLAAGIIDHHDVKILDMRFDKNLEEVIQNFNPDVVGITAYTVNVNTVKKLAEIIKSLNPEIFIVVGGHHATVVPKDFLTPHIDLVVTGEGVFTFKEIISRIATKKNFEGVLGIAYMNNSQPVIIPPAPLTDLDISPFPVRKLTEKYRKHYFSEWMKPLASIRTSKGCPYRCTFCALWKLTDGKYLKRKPENIVKELAEIEEEFVFFADDESLVDYNRMKTLASLIKDAGLKKRFFLYGRSDTIAKHPDLIEVWKKVGLERIFIGLEFFRDDDLNYINKSSTVKDNREAVKILLDNNIEMYASFIIRPEFTKEDFRAFTKYCRDLKLNFSGFSALTPLPGTDLYEEVKDKLVTDNYDLFDFIHPLLPTKLPLKEYFKKYKNLFKYAKSPLNTISFLMKYPVKEIPQLFRMTIEFYKRIDNAHKDY